MKQVLIINWYNPEDKLPESKEVLIIFKVKDSNIFTFGYYHNDSRYPWFEVDIQEDVIAEWDKDYVEKWAYAIDLIK